MWDASTEMKNSNNSWVYSALVAISGKPVYPVKHLTDNDIQKYLTIRTNPAYARNFANANNFDLNKVMDFVDYSLEYRVIHSPTGAFLAYIDMLYLIIKSDTHVTKSEWRSFFCGADGVCNFDRFPAILEKPFPSAKNQQKLRDELAHILTPELIDRVMAFVDDKNTDQSELLKL